MGAKKSYLRDEDRSYRNLFVVFSGLFAVVTVWAIVDEAWVRRPWKNHREAYLGLAASATETAGIKQVVVPPLDVIDRCPTCHAGVSDARMADDVPPVLRAHPNLDPLLAQHPIERFGCTPCHKGQGLALTAGTAHGEDDPHWLSPMRRGPYVQAACAGCHPDNDALVGAPQLNEGRRLFRELGCGGCHATGDADALVRRGPDLTRVAAKVPPGRLVEWIRTPARLRRGYRMPQFWPGADRDPAVAARRDDESVAIAAYLLSVSEPFPPADAAPAFAPGDADEGQRLFDRLGCRGCHALGSPTDDALEIREQPAADEGDIGGGADGWGDDSGDDGFGDGFGGSDDEPEPEAEAGQADAKAALRPIDFGPQLGAAGARSRPGFIYAWLLSPTSYRADATMPDFSLIPDEARALTAFLSALGADAVQPAPAALDPSDSDLVARGKNLIAQYGCQGCHVIPGFEGDGRPGPDLADYGLKDPHEMYFGDALPEGEKGGWTRYSEIKLRAPRAFATAEISQYMPDFGLSEDEVMSLAVYLRGLSNDAPPTDYVHVAPEATAMRRARALVEARNCHGCHSFDERPGDIARFYVDAHLGPPPLDWEGARVQPQWMFDFLLGPYPLRPWLDIRMPRFGLNPEEASLLVEYFSRLADRPAPLRRTRVARPTAERAALGAEMFGTLKCVTCHLLDNTGGVETAKLAPDLGLARQRLDPAWVREFLVDPGKLLPGTKMPKFFPENQTPFPDLLGGDAAAQIDLLVEHLMNMGLQPAGRAMGRTVRSPEAP